MKKFILFSLCLLLAMNAASWAQGIDTLSSDLPPDGDYVALSDEYLEYSAAGQVYDDAVLTPFVLTAIRENDGDDEIETFDATLDATEIIFGLGPVTLTGPVQTRTTDRLLSTTGLFDTEIISMSLSGNVPLVGTIMIREDPARASTGVTDIADLGGGLYHIDSFFDVFTELSVDGGSSWVPSDYSTRFILTPEPATMLLLGLGGIMLRRRKQ